MNLLGFSNEQNYSGSELTELQVMVGNLAEQTQAGMGILNSLRATYPDLESPQALVNPALPADSQPTPARLPLNRTVIEQPSTETTFDPNSFYAEDNVLSYARADNLSGYQTPPVAGVIYEESAQALHPGEYLDGIENTVQPDSFGNLTADEIAERVAQAQAKKELEDKARRELKELYA